MQNGSTRNFIYDVRYIVGYLSGLMTLSPGDLIATGTPAGVGHGMKPPVYLNPGDVWSIGGIKAQLTEPPFSAPTPPSRRRSSPGTARTTSVSRDSLREQ